MATPEDGVTVEYQPNADPEGGEVAMKTPDRPHYHSLTGSEGGGKAPILFERASKKWWNPQFDSFQLEEAYQKSTFVFTKRRFQVAMGYVMLCCIAWLVFFFLVKKQEGQDWIEYVAGTIVLLVIAIGLLGFSFAPLYQRLVYPTSIVVSLILILFGLLSFIIKDMPLLSAVGTFVGSMEIILMMYTIIPLPLFLGILFGIGYSVIYEVLSVFVLGMSGTHYIAGRVLIHVCFHLIGIYIYIMSQVRRRCTFLRVCESVLMRQEMEAEKKIKQQSIYSLMPATVADEVMKQRGDKEEDDDDTTGKSGQDQGSMKFRNFHMSKTDNTSILFADIVGFTKMSSNKTAEHLVGLLNDLFGRFDIICEKTGCEKISTLGDCYYCVSGCPEAKADHATCCVEMGLAMCKAIKEFDEDHNEEVGMRVGVHTGVVLCGLVGTRRFKFDVWSHDVTLANLMESEGKQGTVHISDSTYKFVQEDFEVEPGEEVEDIRKHKVLTEEYDKETQSYIVKHVQEKDTIKTWFITGRKRPIASPEMVKLRVAAPTDETEVANGGDRSQGQAHGGSTDKTTPQLSDKSQTNHTDSQASKTILDTTSADFTDCQISQNEHEDVYGRDNNPLLKQNMDVHTNTDFHGDSLVANGYRSQLVGGLCKFTDDGQLVPMDDISLTVSQSDANNVPTSNLLCKKETTNTSTEEIGESTADTALMDQLQQVRAHELTDKHLIKGLEQSHAMENYFYKSPINVCTLNFKKRNQEQNYRREYTSSNTEVASTFAMPKFTAVCDMIVSLIFLILISACCFLGFTTSIPLVIVVIFALIIELFMLIPLLCSVCCGNRALGKLAEFCSQWYPRHAFGSVVASLPAFVVFANFSCSTFETLPYSDLFFCLLVMASLLHYANFTMLSSWMKSALAIIISAILVILLALSACKHSSSMIDTTNGTILTNIDTTTTGFTSNENNTVTIFSSDQPLKCEIILDLVLFLLLICFLNRDTEISYRLRYYGDREAKVNKDTMKREKEQANWLLHNIIPAHVYEVLTKHSKYCRNHKDVGVIFAKVVNFDDFYDESFEGGREYLRVLNELLSDLEDLFDNPKYKDIEKIKTIGSCLMAASGLNPQTRSLNKDPNAHLYALMDFSVELLEKIEQFNAEIFNFNFEMAIGFNFGEVTSGVIGSTKLLYDIWGDTVNVSSRMYSTGLPGKIQVTEDCSNKLLDVFEFEYRGKIFVKGKGDLNTYILTGKKDNATWE